MYRIATHSKSPSAALSGKPWAVSPPSARVYLCGGHASAATYPTRPRATAAPASLFERIGTALDVEPQVAVDKVAGLFVDTLLEDDRVSHFFTSRGTDRDSHVKHLEMFIAVAFGKPRAKYNFSEEGVDNLTKAHASMGIEAKHFEIVASHLQGCMERADVPADLVAEGVAVVNSTKDEVLGTVE